MKRQRLPRGWTERQVRDLAARHDSQTNEQQAAEIEAALTKKGQTLMVVPMTLVPQIRKLISRQRAG